MKSAEEKVKPQPLPDYEGIFAKASFDEDKNKVPAKVLREIFRGNFFNIIINTFIHLLDAVGDMFMPVATANIITAVTLAVQGKQPNAPLIILINFALAVLAVAINLPLYSIYNHRSNTMLRNIGAGLRNTLVKKLQHLSITYHKEIEKGRLQAKFIRDIEAIEFFNTHLTKSLIPLIFLTLIYFGIALSKSGIVAIFYLVVIPVNVIILNLFRDTVKSNSHTFRRENENVSASVTTMIEMLPVTKAHGLENVEIKKLEENIKALKTRALALDRTTSFFASVSYIGSATLKLLCLVFSAFLALKGKIQVGDIVLFQTYFNSISAFVQQITGIYPELSKGIESVKSVSEVMLSNKTEDDKGKIPIRYLHGSIDFENISYRYPNADEDTIKDFSLSVNPGECIAFVGSSGSGKSTIINLIIGFLMPTKGVLKIDGKPIDALNLSAYRQFISVVPQNTVLFNGTIKENILYGVSNITDEKFEQILESANINEFLPILPNGLNTIVGENGDKLSGGQKQRISIARALIRDPSILVLDEATSALDNISEHHVQQAIQALIKDRTTFIVAHRLSTIRNADKIVVMDKGRIVEIGTYEELMAKKGAFYELKKLNDISQIED